FERIIIRPIELRGERQWQFQMYSDRQCHTKNYPAPKLDTALKPFVDFGYSAWRLEVGIVGTDLRLTRKGQLTVGQSKLATATSGIATHNRSKDVPIPEGRADTLLEALGIMTAAGMIRASMRAKYTQINEFLKHLDHALAEIDTLNRSPLRILDCGCGSSRLTLAAHHYLNHIQNRPAELLGVDVNPAVIAASAARAEELGAEGIQFACATIARTAVAPDIVFSLHACDTATDDALALAVEQQAALILSVPCCHKNLNQQLSLSSAAAVMAPLLRHGLFHERQADLLTDTFRALALQIMGYKVRIVEFTSPEHTARNVMLRATRSLTDTTKARQEYIALKAFWGVSPYIETALGASFRERLGLGEVQRG
ncbi:MAG: methyltransferase, partial [Gemmataceae bacterium]